MRTPRCAEPVAYKTAEGNFRSYAACNQPTPCPDHPDGKIDTVLDIELLHEIWARAYERSQK